MSEPSRPRAVVLVEGHSDRLALETLAERRGRDLVAEGISVVPMGGAKSIMERLGFYVCDADLEDELIRALGAGAVERIVEAQLRRSMGTRGGRKHQYAPLLVAALDPGTVPRPLDRVLAHL